MEGGGVESASEAATLLPTERVVVHLRHVAVHLFFLQPPTRRWLLCRLQDRSRMYSVGSLFYAIYFFVSFPMFFRMDENPKVRLGLQLAVVCLPYLGVAGLLGLLRVRGGPASRVRSALAGKSVGMGG